MNLKRIFKGLTIFILLILLIVESSKVFAATATTPLYLGIVELRTNSDPNMAYSIGDPNTDSGHIIWNILEYGGTGDNAGIKANGYKNIYCVNPSIGFNNVGLKGDYNTYYNMKTESETVKGLSSVKDTTIPLDDNTTISSYNAILELGDMLYLPNKSTEQEKQDLLNIVKELATKDVSASSFADGMTTYPLTDDDINAVQQAAIWYFTNYGEDKYDMTANTLWLKYKTGKMTEYKSLSDYNLATNEGKVRAAQANVLYKYLINTAKTNAMKNSNNSSTEAPAKVNTTTLGYEESGSNYLVGPINITEKEGNTKSYTIDFSVKNNETAITNYTILNSSKTEVATGEQLSSGTKNIKELVGDNFYILVSKDNIKNISVDISIKYNTSTLTLWTKATDINGTQPVMIPEPKQVTVPVTLTVTPKSKTGVYNVVLVKEDADGEQLNSTATFKVNGVTKQVTGRLEIAKDVQITSENLGESDVYEIEETIAPDEYCEFDGKIKVTVTKKEENGNYKVDTISYVVTDAKGNDITNAAKDKVNVYLNENGNIYVEVKNYQFDLKLIKRITALNNQNVPERIQKIDVTKLNTRDKNGNLITTADYTLNKEPVGVKKGDIVTYTFRIFNEGTIDGYASEITEDIPEGLEFIYSDALTDAELDADTTLTDAEKEAVKFNRNYYWTYADKTLSKIKTDYLSKENETTANGNLIKAFGTNDGSKTEKDLDYREVSVMLKVVSEDVTGKVIRNEACISEDTDSNGYSVDDRDSDTEKWKGKDENPNHEDDKYEDDEDYDNIILKSFDLALRKFIVAVSDDTKIESDEYIKNTDGSYTRAPIVDTSKLNTLDENNKLITTAIYNHTKKAVEVKKNDIVVYMLRVYNEGEIDGYAAEIKDHLPSYLEFVEGDFNKQYGWTVSDDGRTVTTNYLENAKINKAVKNQNPTTPEKTYTLSYKEVPIMCKVKDTAKTSEKITNIADITKYLDENKKSVTDRDSQEDNVKLPSDEDLPGYKDNEADNYIPGQQDDDDFEKVIIKRFDLALRKFIVAVSDDTKIESDEYIKNTDGSYTREPIVDTSKLYTLDENNKLITTAIYNHTKKAVEVKKNDIVVYMLRVYNEGEIDGYAAEIKDHLPSYLEFVEGDFNKQYGWTVSDDGRTVTTNYLENAKINKAVKNQNPTTPEKTYTLSYKEVPIMCKVKDTAKTNEKITNIADITKYLDENKKSITDIDSQEDNVKLPSDENLPVYKDNETGNYIPGQQDDDDFEKVIIKRFDLALRKFITAIEGKEVTTRVPQVKYENGQISYEHDKDPLMVVTDNVVTYTIRIFNEGEVDGYAKEITDDIPEGLEFLPDNNINKTMRWKMIDKDGKETTDVSKAVKITTDYLSKEQESKKYGNLLKAFNPNKEISATNPDYKDVQVAFKVTEPNSSDRIIVNSAQISDDSDKDGKDIDDDDSIPNVWNEGEDDQDREYIKLVEFDLALRKWVTQAIVIDKNGQTITETGHDAWDDPEQVVKVELNRKKLNEVTVKFRYSIRVYNQGDIAGYAKEVTDYVPEGLKFVADDNPGWTDEGNNVISTRLLENTLLQPGEYADVEVILTWINDQNNMGVMTNTAEISEDYNEYGVHDRDSTPDNKKLGEDDIDDAPVMLSVSTGQMRIYFTLGFVVLATIAGGIVLIRKYVL